MISDTFRFIHIQEHECGQQIEWILHLKRVSISYEHAMTSITEPWDGIRHTFFLPNTLLKIETPNYTFQSSGMYRDGHHVFYCQRCGEQIERLYFEPILNMPIRTSSDADNDEDTSDSDEEME